jgi:protein TonB
MEDRRGNRVLRHAVLASLVLHAVVLFGVFPELIDTAARVVASPVPLIARLMEPAPEPVPAPAPVAPPPPEVKPLPKPKADKPLQVDKPAAPPIAAAIPQPQPAPPAPPSAVPAVPSPAPAAPVVAAPAPVPSDEQSADRYRMELIAALARMIRDSYPPQARENNWEGDVLLGVVVRANGSVAVSVKRGSSFDVLDEKALAVVRQAAQEVPVPPALRGRESPLRDLLVQYRLKD